MKVNNGKGGSGGSGGGGDGHTLPPSATTQEVTDGSGLTPKLFTPTQVATMAALHADIAGVHYVNPTANIHQANNYQITSTDFVAGKMTLFQIPSAGSGYFNISLLEDDANIPNSFVIQASRASHINIVSDQSTEVRFGPESPTVIRSGQTATFRRLSANWWHIDVSVGIDEWNVLDHFSYDADRNLVAMDVALSTTLATIWLSDQWGFKSGGKSVFFSSTDQDTNFSPIMRGIKNQAIAGNQDSSGIIAPFYRKYSETLLQGSLKGDMSTFADEVTPYEGVSTLTANVAVFGVRAVLGEDLKLNDKLWYRLWGGFNDTGPKLFEQSLTVTADRTAGFDFTGWWSAPSEGFDTENVFARITVEPADGTPTRTLMVRAIDTDETIHWNELQYRTFEDIPVPLDAGYSPKILLRSAEVENIMRPTQADNGSTLVFDVGGTVVLNSTAVNSGFKLKLINLHNTASYYVNLGSFGSVVTSTGYASSGPANKDGFSVRANSALTVIVNKDSAGLPVLYLEEHNPVADLERRTGEDRLDASAIKNLGSAAKAGVDVIAGASSAIRHQDAAILQLDQFEEFVRFNVADMQEGFGYVTFDYHTTLASQQMNLTAVSTALLGAPFAFNAAGVDGVGLIVGGQDTRVSGQPVPYSVKVKYNLKNGLLRFLVESVGFVDEPTAYTEAVRDVTDNLPVSIVLRAQGSPSLADSVIISGAG